MRVDIWTTAEPAYDYWYVVDHGVVAYTTKGKPVRWVDIPETSLDYQTARYASGLHMVADAAEWKKLLDNNLVTRAEPPRERQMPETD